MMDKQVLGANGEFFVRSILEGKGFEQLEYNGECRHIDFIMQKKKTFFEQIECGGKCKRIDFIMKKEEHIIKLQIKCSQKKLRGMQYRYKRNRKDYLDVTWNFICFTDLKDVWILPYEYMKRKSERGFLLRKTEDIFKNKYELLEMNEHEIMTWMWDNQILFF